MPLLRGTSSKTRKKNIETEIAAGRPVKVAVAIALNEQDRTRKKKKRRGR